MSSPLCSFLGTHSVSQGRIIFSSVFHSNLYKYQRLYLEHYIVLTYIFVSQLDWNFLRSKIGSLKFYFPNA